MGVPRSRFEARAFNPDLGPEVTAGSIVLDAWKLRFQSDTLALEIPLERLEVKMAEDEEDRIFFTDPAQSGWNIFTTDLEILQHRALAPAGDIRDRLSAAATRRELSRRMKIVLWFAGVGSAVALLGWAATATMVRSLVHRIPLEWEQEIGDALIESLREEGHFLEDTKRAAQVAALAAPLMRVVPPPKNGFTFHVVENQMPNAWALPGGHVIVHTGLMELADRPEELLGAIAHEVAHVSEKHGFRKAISAAGPILIFGIFLRGGGGLLGVLSDGSGLLVRQSFSQEFEKKADDVGWGYLVAANVDPRGLIELLIKLRSHELSQGNGPTVPSALRSHPALDQRIARLEAKWTKLPRQKAFPSLQSVQPNNP